jgi:hypothetical protein
VEWERHDKRASLAFAALGLDRSAVLGHDHLGGRQPDPAAGDPAGDVAAALAPFEFEYVRQVLRQDANP